MSVSLEQMKEKAVAFKKERAKRKAQSLKDDPSKAKVAAIQKWREEQRLVDTIDFEDICRNLDQNDESYVGVAWVMGQIAERIIKGKAIGYEHRRILRLVQVLYNKVYHEKEV